MKPIRDIITIVCIVAAPFPNHAAESPKKESKAAAEQSIATTTLVYETAEQIRAMRRCQATADGRTPCSVRLITSDGKRFQIGSPGSTKEVSGFLKALKKGQSYTLPDAFLDYQKASK